MVTPTPVEIREKALLFTLAKRYRDGMSPEELYEATRGFWRVGSDREDVELALAVYRGVVEEVYRVHAWHPSGTTAHSTREDVDEYRDSGRWKFDGSVADDLRDVYFGRWVGGGQNPVRYLNVKPTRTE